MVAISFWLWFNKGEEKLGLDFTGGHEVIVELSNINAEAIKKTVQDSGIKEVSVQPFEVASNQYSVKVGSQTETSKQIREQLEASLKAKGATVIRSEFIGPVVGQELRNKALIALILALLGIVAYITFRFEFSFALGAIVALVHDVIVSAGVYMLLDYQFSMATLAAALTIVGYSVNDTIVIFDKIREELRKRPSYNLETIMNECINLLLSRTLITSGLTLFSATALYLFGGGAIADLSIFMVAGIIAGSYSTIFIASPIVLAWENRKRIK
jgi:preprotein translocase subunit SecF